MNTEDIVARLKAFAQTHTDIVAIYLFGSQASGHARRDSDVDLAVLLRPGDRNLFDLELKLDVEISKQVSDRETEVIVLNRVPLPLQFEIISTGRLLHSNDEKLRTDWEVSMLGDYWDIRPFLREYDRATFKRLKERFTDDQWREYYRARASLAGTH